MYNGDSKYRNIGPKIPGMNREVAAEIVVLRGQLLEQTGRARIAQQALAQAKQSCEADIAGGAVLMTQGGGLDVGISKFRTARSRLYRSPNLQSKTC